MALILIAESNLPAADYAASTLIKAGFETRVVDGQAEALAVYQERRPDLVLADFFLAEGDGLALLQALKRVAPDALAVMTTGLGSERLVREAFMAGADDYVVKDASYYRDLPAMAAAILDKRAQAVRRRSAEHLRERLDAQRELAGWLDHNFRNILSAVAGSLSLINFDQPAQSQDKRREYLADGLASLREALKLVEGLGRMNSQGSAEDVRTVNVAASLDQAWGEVIEQLKRAPESSAASLDEVVFVNAARRLPPLRLVSQDLLTISEILLKNAVEAARQSAEPMVTAAGELEDGHFVLTVKDNGPGMDEKVARHAFEPLFSTKGQVGVGLSLTTVKALAARHHGEASIESTPGRGAVVRVSWRLGPN
ncbi:MAG: sensor histidine kinase [Deltaproteobacteria bacterium]|nr:sensor histidine kinase [Deltaproteobacteria bacterium]